MSNLVLNFKLTEVKRIELNDKEGETRVQFMLKLFCPEYKVENNVGPFVTTRIGQLTYYMFRDLVANTDGSEIKLGEQDGSVEIPIEHVLFQGEMIPTKYKVVKRVGKGQFEGQVFKHIYEI